TVPELAGWKPPPDYRQAPCSLLLGRVSTAPAGGLGYSSSTPVYPEPGGLSRTEGICAPGLVVTDPRISTANWQEGHRSIHQYGAGAASRRPRPDTAPRKSRTNLPT